MTDTLSKWLSLREKADHAARSESLTRAVAAAVATPGILSIVDLATGTGSNLRFLAPRLAGRQQWLAIDRDAALLSELPDRMRSWSAAQGLETSSEPAGFRIAGANLDCRVETRQMDLADLDGEIFEGRRLVTASALLDLVSEEWLRTLAARCRSAGAAALLALTYDGRSSCTPAEPGDDLMRDLLNRHQGRDKGLGGPAAGPAATLAAQRAFRDEGYVVQSAASDWMLGTGDGELQRQLIDGWAHAGRETAPDRTGAIESWLERRLTHLAAGRSEVVVGHQDLAASLPGGRG